MFVSLHLDTLNLSLYNFDDVEVYGYASRKDQGKTDSMNVFRITFDIFLKEADALPWCVF